MDLAGLDQCLDETPIIARMHPISLAFLERPVRVFATAHEMALTLDTNIALPLERWLTFDTNTHYLYRFPEVNCTHNPFTTELDRILLSKYDWISQNMLNQRQIAERITSEAIGLDTIVLVLLDGLSYQDCLEWHNVEPCLTILPSITSVCFPAIVNDPPIASRLFKLGFERRVGFTYWNREDNTLTDTLFRTIRDIHVTYSQFSQITEWLCQDTDLHHTYIQIVRTALDDFADGIRVTVPRDVLVRGIWDDILAVVDALRSRKIHAKIYATSDHGLLWRDANHPFEMLSQETGSQRYGATRPAGSRGRWVDLNGSRTWVLDYPQLRRDFHKNQQGTHGGYSFEECVTPFISLEV